MSDWLKRLIADKNGNPNEHIVAALWGSFALGGLTAALCYLGHPPGLTDFGMAHGAIWTAAGAGQRLSAAADMPAEGEGDK
jgi:hypothetical protein